jgi:signal transduction histidine kinase
VKSAISRASRFCRRFTSALSCILFDGFLSGSQSFNSILPHSPSTLIQVSTHKSALLSYGLALLAAVTVLTLWHTGFVARLSYAFVLPGVNESGLRVPRLSAAAFLAGLTSLTAAFLVNRLGARRAFPFLGGGFVGLALLSLLASKFFSLNILFMPVSLATFIAVAATQAQRLWSIDVQLRDKLFEAALKLNSLQTEEARSRLLSGLKLLDTVLSLNEAVVFERTHDGTLVSAARLRASTDDSLSTTRNLTWREGIRLCERAITTGEILLQENEDSSTNLALPLKHERQTVGALLLRLADKFDNEDRPLLSAVGAQMARNLQREEVCKSATKPIPISFLSARASQGRLDSLDVLNGLLTEQRVGVNALSEISDGLAIAYLDGTLAYINAPLLHFVHLAEGDAQDLNVFSLLDTLRTDIFDEPAIAVRRVLQTGAAYERELDFSERNEIFGLRISLVLDQAAHPGNVPQPLCLAISLRDLTRLKQYEQLKSDMISLMSHELRTPLTSINGFAELLTSDQELPEQAKEFVTIIANESQRMSRMINTFLAVTQLERKDKQEVLKIPLRLDDVVRETIVNLQPVAKRKRIRLVEQPTQRLPPVAADRSLISQAVKNLVHNAIKYSPERTTVTVSTALEAEVVRVCVEDRGFGIPPEAVGRVWEKFYRVVREDQDKDEESTGLGLSFVREVVEQHGGAVDLESEVGRGSKFSFTLPRL